MSNFENLLQAPKFRLSKKISHHETLFPEILFTVQKRERLRLLFSLSRSSRSYLVKYFFLVSLNNPIMKALIRKRHFVSQTSEGFK